MTSKKDVRNNGQASKDNVTNNKTKENSMNSPKAERIAELLGTTVTEEQYKEIIEIIKEAQPKITERYTVRPRTAALIRLPRQAQYIYEAIASLTKPFTRDEWVRAVENSGLLAASKQSAKRIVDYYRRDLYETGLVDCDHPEPKWERKA